MIKVNDLINSHSIEEHNNFADAYFHNRENDIYLYQKARLKLSIVDKVE